MAGFTLSGSVCTVPNCAAISPFCRKCSGSLCLECATGTYLNSAGKCSQGASLLCTTANGPYFTNCVTSSFDCPSHASIQTDVLTGLQTTVCLPKKASKDNEYLYFSLPSSSCPAGACTTPHQTTLTFNTLKPFF